MTEPAKNPKKVGAALVLGGGIAGMQASLDLAEAGYYVYLVEKSPSIGGTMARLDKTFPTNDCAMCILSPKLVECGRHLNIETMTCSDLVDIQGDEGNFRVTVKKNPRYIDVSKCTGCQDCEKACPVVLDNEYEGGLNKRRAVFRPFPQAYPNAFTIDKAARPLCQVTCPAGVHAQGYVALIAEGKFEEALRLEKMSNPLPAICGRVCHHPCESNCNRGLVDEPIAICSLKRFIADYEYDKGLFCDPEPGEARDERVAIVGAGPAGLTCAYDLALKGYQVTVFEALPEPGGMLRYGIPAYRLPRDILKREIEAIERLGVKIQCEKRLGREFTLASLREEGYSCIFLAVGAHGDQKMGIPGEDKEGMVSGVEFLRDLNLGRPVRVGRRVLVVGGGNVAIDVARSALRLGSEKVTIVYRRARGEMPAAPHEVEEALHEGIDIQFLTAPVSVMGDGAVKGLVCQRMRLGKPDASGRRRPEAIPGSEFEIEADMVVAAIGQAPQLEFASEDPALKVSRWGTLEADSDTAETAVPGVFAGGDAVSGPATVVEAVAVGKRAAESIHRFINEMDTREGRDFSRPEAKVVSVPKDARPVPRAVMSGLPLEERLSGFQEVELGFTEEQAVAEAKRCLDCGVCSECMECVRVCKAKAVDHEMVEEVLELEVGAIVLAPGFEAYDPAHLNEYGYGKCKNVVTSVEFERILSASGPFEGHVVRPSDHKQPKNIAFLQCVGSRDEHKASGYCSSVCCMYAIKEAVIAKEHVAGNLDVSIFFMDMRAYGKDFEKYYSRAQDEHKVRFVRAKVREVKEDPDSGNLLVKYVEETGESRTAEFDMVVLSVGMKPNSDVARLARKVGIHLDDYGYRRSSGLNSVKTSMPGVFAAGAFASPKDIPETVMEASAAAAAVGQVLFPQRWSMVKEKEYPAEKNVANQAPRVGVFICNCGINIGGVVKVPEVLEYAKSLPDVVFADANMYTCSQDTQDRMKDLVQEHDLNRVVVASCSPRTHEPLFQQTVKEAGLNSHLFEMANIRDQCSWVHMSEPRDATEKAKDLVRMAVAKARLLEPLYPQMVGLTKKALVIGGGVSGMTAALGMADQGFPVCLVERQPELGGNLRHLDRSIDGEDLQKVLQDLLRRVKASPFVDVYTGAEIRSIDGFVGNFKTTIAVGGREVQYEHGVVVVATGGREHKPTEYLYGIDPRVITQQELEIRMRSGEAKAKRIVMIQCVGSREPQRPYCSRLCCTQAVKNALALKGMDPETEVIILYRDMRTYGLYEDYYSQARAAGVTFLRYDLAKKPKVTGENGTLSVDLADFILGRDIRIEADMVVLSAAVEPYPDSRQVAQMLKVPVNEDAFFLEAHVKLRPVDFATDGVFLAGLAHAPKMVRESMAQALAAVGRAATVLAKDHIEAHGTVSVVDESKCVGCKACEELCQFSAIKVDPEKNVARVESAVCKGCGACAATCRSGAIALKGFTDEEIMAEVAAFR
ncbi:MAG: NAD(P)-binding protein [Bacillota bacterium]